MRPVLVVLIASALAACADSNTPADPYDDVVVEDGTPKADSQAQPSPMGVLPFDLETPNELSLLTSGYHLYTLRVRAGWGVRVMVKSHDFKPYVRISARHDRSLRWTDRAEVRTPGDEAYTAILDVLDFPEDGDYDVLVSSTTNMSVFPLPISWGDYELYAETDVECPLDGDAADCPDTLSCQHADGDRDGFGTCLR